MSPKSDRQPQHWWVTASERNPKRSWRWDTFFDDPEEDRFWSRNWVKSGISRARITKMCEGDLVVAYQASEGAVGLACVDSKDDLPRNSVFGLKPNPAVKLKQVVAFDKIRDLPDARNRIEFLR